MRNGKENDDEWREKSSNSTDASKPQQMENDKRNSNEQCITKNPGVRESLAQSMHTITDFVNEHLILVRYATLSSVLLLGAYSISQTPLFFRYRTAKDIPKTFFSHRRVLTCRVFRAESPVRTPTEEVASSIAWSPIVLRVKHLSPAGLLLSRNHFEIGSKFSPTAVALGRNDDSSDLIRVQLYGVSQESQTSKQNSLLQDLAQDRAMVRCELLSTITDNQNEIVIIAHLTYWEAESWWPVDLGKALVQSGLARVQHNVVLGQHGSDRLQDKRRDIQYLEAISKIEYDAISKRSGMWSIPSIRAASQDAVDHVEWVTTATWYQKIWRRIAGRH